jgi:NAD(P)-dependent dehydrogenase (short-subunit alcohol dehydrogenase family)
MRRGASASMSPLSNKVIVLTGAAGNLGRATASALDTAGAQLALLDRRSGRLKEMFGGLSNLTHHLLLDAVDVTNAESVGKAIDQVIKRYGQIDGLVHSVGGYRAGNPVHETSVEIWEAMYDLNARSAFILTRAVIPTMLEQGCGKIVTIGARPGLRGIANAAAYASSKSAVIRLTESLAAELKHQGINVNCVVPGTIDSSSNRSLFPDAKHDRWVKPEDIANTIVFLLSDAARAIHGATIPVFGTG